MKNNSKITFDTLLESIATSFYRLPKALRKLTLPFVESIGTRFFQFGRYLSIQGYLVTGLEKFQKMPLKVIYYGDENALDYLSEFLFEGKCEKKPLDKIFIWNVKKVTKSAPDDTDLMFINSDRFFCRYFEKKDFFAIPEWINMTLDTSRSLYDIMDNFSKGAIKDVKRISKYGYTYEITDDPEKLNFFYNRMFLPYISKKYGDLVPFSYQSYIKNLLARTSLLLIKENEKYVCGGLIDFKKNTANLPSMGIIDGDTGYLKKGVAVALFYFHILHAKEAGLASLDYGDARAFLNDGGLQYKRKWGMKVDLSDYIFAFFYMKIMNLSDGVKSFLINNPFIFLENNELKSCIYIEKDHPVNYVEIEEIFKKYKTSGLSQISIVSFSGFNNDIELFAPINYKKELSSGELKGKKVSILHLISKK